MAYASFSQFIAALEEAGELTRIPFPVATELAIAEWADREMKSPGGGKALLFEQPTIAGAVAKFPVAINTMAPKSGWRSHCGWQESPIWRRKYRSS